jgi:CHASE2 domain-containing sensor protein/signal transduction histidine kinase
VRPPSPLLQPLLRQWLVLLASLSAGILVAVWSGWLWRADLALYDAGLAYGPAPDDIVIVAVDDASLAQVGAWPWRRAIHAALLERLRSAGVRAVALDFVFTEPDAVAPQDDATLAAAIARGPPTVLPLIVDWQHAPTRLRESRPIAPLAAAAAGLAHTHLEIDRDGIARSVFLREGLGRPDRSHMALALLEAANRARSVHLPGARHPAGPAAATAWVRDFHVLIPFLGPAGSFRQVSYVDVLRGTVPAAELHDKLVLVGATAQGLGDAFPTPRSGEGIAMPGVEISANVLQALRSDHAIRPVSQPWTALLALLPLGAAFVGFLRLSARNSLLWIAGLWLATLGGSLLALRYGYWWWSPAAALAALALAYPLWSWRRLDATQVFLDEELARLDREPLPLPHAAPVPHPTFQLFDLLQRRIDRVRDATARLRDLRQLLGETIAALPDAVLLVDLEGRVVLANPGAAALCAAPSSSALTGESVENHLAALFAGREPSLRELAARAPCSIEVQHADGRDLMLRVAAFHGGDGRRAGTVIDIADVSELKRAEREREDTISFLSHDLRSPSSSLLGLAEVLRDPRRAPPPEETARRIESLASRTLALADGFIALARAHVIEPRRFEFLDLRDALQDAIDEVWATAEAKHVALETHAGTDVAAVHGDRQMLGRALANLINNAVKYSPRDARVVVAIDRQGSCYAVTVRDDGPGIARDRQRRLFQRFQRGVHHGDFDPGGVGLGLAFVRVVAHKHGGTVAVHSDAGRGAEFRFTVPAAGAA